MPIKILHSKPRTWYDVWMSGQYKMFLSNKSTPTVSSDHLLYLASSEYFMEFHGGVKLIWWLLVLSIICFEIALFVSSDKFLAAYFIVLKPDTSLTGIPEQAHTIQIKTDKSYMQLEQGICHHKRINEWTEWMNSRLSFSLSEVWPKINGTNDIMGEHLSIQYISHTHQ